MSKQKDIELPFYWDSLHQRQRAYRQSLRSTNKLTKDMHEGHLILKNRISDWRPNSNYFIGGQ